MRPLVLLLIVALAPSALAPSARAQTAPVPGTCTLGTATAVIDAGEVSARVFNMGSLFYGNGYSAAYVVPKRDGVSPNYATSLWLAGKVGGEVRVAGGTYGAPTVDFTFWPGPLGADARPVDPADCAPYDRIYTVSRDDVAAYYRTGVASDDLRDWPASLGAPVLDGDGDPANYDLAAGDQPAITGAQTAWWLMNDVGGPHPAQATPPLGVEVRVEAVAFPFGVLGQTTLYRYTITNRTAATIDDAYVGLFADPDLGDPADDQVGTDTTGSMMVVYNDDNDDGRPNPTRGYGLNPPAIGFQVVSGPVGLPNGRDDDRDGQVDEAAERLMLTAAFYFSGGPSGGNIDPDTGREIYSYMSGRWGDGSVMREFGDGYQESQGAVTSFAFPGDPVTNQPWSARNPGAGRAAISGADRRFMISTGPFRLAPGASETVVFALPYARGASNLDSITRLRGVAGGIIEALRAGYLDPTRVERPAPTVDPAVRLSLPAPNPFRERTVVRYQIPTGTPMRATLSDARGRRIAVLFDGPTAAPEGELTIDGAGLAPGVYRVQIVVPGGERFLTLVRTR